MTVSRVATRANASSSPTLSRGANGEQVVELQRLLRRASGEAIARDGDFGPKTEAAVRGFQAKMLLQVDGVVGPETWNALRRAPLALARAWPTTMDVFGGGLTNWVGFETQAAAGLDVTVPVSATSTMNSRVLELARGQLGTFERTGHNDGEIEKYARAFGRGRESWCADFVSWLATQAGGQMDEYYTPSIVNALKARGTWKGRANPEPGDLVLFDWNHNRVADHVGIVERVNANGTIDTIEGNAEDVVTRRQGVVRRTRGLSTVLGFGPPF